MKAHNLKFQLFAAGLLLVILGLTTFANLPDAGAAAARPVSDAEEMQAALNAVGQGSTSERLRRITGGRAGWPTEVQAAQEFKILRESKEFAPARNLPHAESGNEVDRVRRVLKPLFELHGGGSTLIISVLHTQHPILGIGRGSVLLLSNSLLEVLSDDELLALAAHEVGHQYFRREFAKAEDAGDQSALRIIEFKCDAIAALSLKALGLDPAALLRGLAWAKGTGEMAVGGDTRTHPEINTRKRFLERLAL